MEIGQTRSARDIGDHVGERDRMSHCDVFLRHRGRGTPGEASMFGAAPLVTVTDSVNTGFTRIVTTPSGIPFTTTGDM